MLRSRSKVTELENSYQNLSLPVYKHLCIGPYPVYRMTFHAFTFTKHKL